jgi:ethanolamine permease
MQLRGAREAVGVTMVVGIIAITVLLLFCVAMMPYANVRNLVSPQTGGLLPHGFVGVLASVPFALWLFLGVEQAALAAEETADPGKTIPKALTIAIATLLFVGLSVLIFGPAGGGLQRLAGADDPLYAALTSPLAYGGESWLTITIGIGALVGLVATFFSVVYTSSRQLYSLARDGYLPRVLTATNRKQAPHMALLGASAIGFGATLFPPEQGMLLVIFLLTVSYLFILAAFVRLRTSQPDLPRPFRALGGSLTAIVTAALALIVVWACFVQQPTGMIYALVVYVALILHFMIFHRPRIERLKVTAQ